MHPLHAQFLEAIKQKRQISLRYFHRKDDKEYVAVCAPLDFGPLRGSIDGLSRYQLWDLHPKKARYNVAVLAEDIRELTVLDDTFDPARIITWNFKPKAWHIARNWGEFS